MLFWLIPHTNLFIESSSFHINTCITSILIIFCYFIKYMWWTTSQNGNNILINNIFDWYHKWCFFNNLINHVIFVFAELKKFLKILYDTETMCQLEFLFKNCFFLINIIGTYNYMTFYTRLFNLFQFINITFLSIIQMIIYTQIHIQLFIYIS